MRAKKQGRSLRSAAFRALSVVGIAAIAFASLSYSPSDAPAYAANEDLNLPTWDDVQKAKNDTAAAAKQVTEIEGLISQVQSRLEAARARSEDASRVAYEAQQDYEIANATVVELEQQAEESRVEAEAAAQEAAALVSEMYRSGGIDRSVELFLETDGDTADTLLDRLSMMEKATQRSTTLADEAEQTMNTARSLGEQAEDAKVERQRLKEIAEAEAQQAAQAVETERVYLQQQEDNQRLLQAQLDALRDTEAKTVEGHKELLRIQEEQRIEREREAARKAEEERKRLEEERRKAEEEAANRPPAGGGGGGGGGGSATPPPSGGGGGGGGGSSTNPSSGWKRPLPSGTYWVSTEWMGYYGHTGIDMAADAWTPIFAAASGTVSLSGWWYGCGNAVRISHGNVTTSYCHMVQSPSVYYGQWVEAGQIVGYVGTTGNSTGNHLHYETMVNGIYTNPRTFMNDRGIWL